ncbi:GDSL esterase/lipase EXL3-like [Rhododendron vialii]|uniref:GDSL esterase/lipase EXL3-like n=1 Tax=Rhododendron vialii TaxID=182163 RepID=UPI00265EF197|nr:GDSL esterase/lipase EXL3-like [Rhododendron vialii]
MEVVEHVKGIWIQGARKIAVNGLPLLGCIPIVITNLPSNPKDSQAEKLQDLESKLPETEIVYIDFEKSLLDVIQNPNEYDFNEANKGCCGTGLIEIRRLCNQTSSPLCVDASKNVFWDAAHPTEKKYTIIFKRNLPAIDAIIAS